MIPSPGNAVTEPIAFFPIRVEQTHWQIASDTLSSIRREVFIDEQGVPEEDEWDHKDYDASHWLAWGSDRVAMATARLAGNKIGRMAVLKPYRGNGVGSALLRAIIKHAVESGMTHLVLDAQSYAVAFYERQGFRVTGEEFMDAGIAHLPMAIDLDRTVVTADIPSEFGAEMRERKNFGGSGEFAAAALSLVSHSRRQLRILSDRLAPEVYGREELCSAILALATSHPYTQVRVLLRDAFSLSSHFHPFIALCRRLQSRIELRTLGENPGIEHGEFITGDDDALLYLLDPARKEGYLCLYSPAEVRRLNSDFDTLWQYGEPDLESRRLHL
ncbi:MAG: GNAT family N-acetyltransferase [Porticoccaceae bacterium]